MAAFVAQKIYPPRAPNPGNVHFKDPYIKSSLNSAGKSHKEIQEFKDRLYEILQTADGSTYGYVYQSLPQYGLIGARPTLDRIEGYKFRELLTKRMKILDIGANCGCMDCSIAHMVKHITGIEISQSTVNAANHVKKFLGVENVTFIHTDFKSFAAKEKFDAILSFAVHMWIEPDFKKYMAKIDSMLKPGGLFWFSTHYIKNKPDCPDRDIALKLAHLKSLGYDLIYAPGYDIELPNEADTRRLFILKKKK